RRGRHDCPGPRARGPGLRQLRRTPDQTGCGRTALRMTSREPAALVDLARQGSRTALARLLTYVESGGAQQLATAALAYQVASPYVVGITGPPGGGKSTLTDRLITLVLSNGSFNGVDPFGQVGILCVDPSSPFTGGAILGDRIR